MWGCKNFMAQEHWYHTRPVDGILSDCVYAIQFSIDDGPRSMLSHLFIGVYLPCLDQGLECYNNICKSLNR